MKSKILPIIGILILSACGSTIVTGPTGPSGSNALVQQTQADPSLCSSGGVVITTGTDTNNNGILDSSEVTGTSVICDGTAAVQSAFTITSPIFPCGQQSAQYKEVLLLLANGDLLSSFSDNVSGYNTRLSLVPDGTYEDTDGSGCVFTISTSGNTRSISWPNGGQSWEVTQ